jgi:predicted PurR-regulated permease PerM
MRKAPASLLILLGAVIVLFWLAPEMPLLGFSSVLLAIALRLPAEWVASHTGMHRWAAVLVLVLGLAALAGLAVFFAAAPLAEQANQLAQDLPRSLTTLRERLAGSGIGDWVNERLQPAAMAEAGGGMAASAASSTINILGNFVLVLLMGIYLAIQPQLYLRGLRALVHPSFEGETRATLAECGDSLRGFLLGQGFAMIVSGLLTWIGLLVLGVPLAGVLAVITALLGFIPYLGPVIAAVPAMLLALTVSPMLALWVALLFMVIQSIEGNILTPLVQSRMADVPPVALLLVQLVTGALFGLPGVALAAPLAAVGLVITRRAYVEGWLGNREIGKPAPKAD